MNRVSVYLLCLFGVLLIVGVGGVSFGLVPRLGGDDSARPPCEQLPDREAVVDAMSSQEDLVSRIQNVGSGVEIEIATPCEGQPEKAIVRVEYTTDTEREGVDGILQQEGFGVPVELIGA